MNIAVTTTSTKLNTLLAPADLKDLKTPRKGEKLELTPTMILTNIGTDIVYIDIRNDDSATVTTDDTPIAVGEKFSVERYLIDEIHLVSAGTSTVAIIG